MVELADCGFRAQRLDESSIIASGSIHLGSTNHFSSLSAAGISSLTLPHLFCSSCPRGIGSKNTRLTAKRATISISRCLSKIWHWRSSRQIGPTGSR